MAKDDVASTASILPPVPKGFCFNAEEFDADADDDDIEFCVERFVKKHRKDASLEQMREELTAYLNILRVAMVELINHDYADFVNLSGNLNGLDKKNIQNLSNPLRQLFSQVQAILLRYDSTLSTIDTNFKQLQMISYQKNQIKNVVELGRLLDGIEAQENASKETAWDLDSLEILALKISNIDRLKDQLPSTMPLFMKNFSQRIKSATQTLERALEMQIHRAFEMNDYERLRSLIKICIHSGKKQLLESIFRKKIIKPRLDQLVCARFLEKNKIHQLYDSIEAIVESLGRIADHLDPFHKQIFMESLWKELMSSLSAREVSLFSAGDPDAFHDRYSATCDFVEKFKLKSNLPLSKLHTEDYVTFMKRFNLSVFYNIRYAQISSKVESALTASFSDYQNSKNSQGTDLREGFRLNSAHILYTALRDIWDSDKKIYLPQLFANFWKLTLQIFSRYSVWLQSLHSHLPNYNNITPNSGDGQSSNGLDVSNLSSSSSTFSQSKITDHDRYLCHNLADAHKFLIMARDLYASQIVVKRPNAISNEELDASFKETVSYLENRGILSLEILVKKRIIQQAVVLLKEISDTSRLYRKTNRDPPTQHQTFIGSSVKVIKEFIDTIEPVLWEPKWTCEVVNEIAGHLNQFVKEVLDSVLKIEQSLQRLKRVRSSAVRKEKEGTISDDDKIRMQISLDVNSFIQKVESDLGLKREDSPKLLELQKSVEAIKFQLNN